MFAVELCIACSTSCHRSRSFFAVILRRVQLLQPVDPATGKDEMVGYANAFTWGDLLHLDTVQIRRKGSLAADKERPWIDLTANGFQLGALLGCYAMRYGYEKCSGCVGSMLSCCCYETNVTQHKRLVRYYKIAGFTALREVGDELSSVNDRLVWGGAGTLMEADIATFLQRWGTVVLAATATATTAATDMCTVSCISSSCAAVMLQLCCYRCFRCAANALQQLEWDVGAVDAQTASYTAKLHFTLQCIHHSCSATGCDSSATVKTAIAIAVQVTRTALAAVCPYSSIHCSVYRTSAAATTTATTAASTAAAADYCCSCYCHCCCCCCVPSSTAAARNHTAHHTHTWQHPTLPTTHSIRAPRT
eukprot:13202-Heterococcus_DN1.PRE.1